MPEKKIEAKIGTLTVNIFVYECPRCGKTHDALESRLLYKAGEVEDKWTHFAMCPDTGQPILFDVQLTVTDMG